MTRSWILLLVLAAGACAPPAPPGTVGYVVSTLGAPVARGRAATGLDLDGEDSTGATGGSCAHAVDRDSFVDPTEHGVDDALLSLVPALAAFLGDACTGLGPEACLDDSWLRRIDAGELLVLVEVSGVDDWTDDRSVQVQLFGATLPAPPVLRGGGLAPGQRFDDRMPLGDPIPGVIRAGRVHAEGAVLDWDLAGSRLQLRRVGLDARIGPDGLDGMLAGAVDVDAAGRLADTITPGLGADVLALLGPAADLEPRPADPTRCASLSAGLSFTAVPAE